MSAVYGIAGFVDGFVGGADVKNRWEDRKLDRKRQERLDAMGEEEHSRRMKILDQNIAATDKAVADQAAMDKVFADSVEAAKAAEAAGAPAASGSAASAAGTPLPMGVMPLGLPNRSGAADAMVERMPAERLAAEAAARAEASKIPTAGRRPAAMPGGPLDAALASASSSVPIGPRRAAPEVGPDFERTGRSGGPAPMGLPDRRDPLAQLSEAWQRSTTKRGDPGPGPVFEQTGRSNPGSISDSATAARLMNEASPEGKARAAAGVERAAALEVENLRRQAYEDGPIPLEYRREAIQKLDEMGFTTNDGGRTMIRKDAGSPRRNLGPRADKTPKAATPASAPPEVKGLAQTAVDAMAETATPAMQAASESASRGLPAPPKGGAKTEAARTKYAKGFMDHYAKVGAPMVVEAFLKRGEFEKAKEFQAFMDSNEAKAGMDNWAKAAFAASVGDMDGFADNIVEAYNRLDYFGDDTTIVKDKSGFTKDKAGNITGARLVFRDEVSGNEFDQVFTDPDDLVRLGITLLAPEQAFEYYYQQQEAAKKASMGLTPQEAAEKAEKDEAELQKRVDSVAKTILDAANDPMNPRKDADGNPLPPMTYAEARAEAETVLRGQSAGQATPAAPPIAYRPAG